VPSPARLVKLVCGCVLLGVGVTLLLLAELGSDGFSTFVYGLAQSTGMPFVVANALVSAGFLAMAWARGVRPGVGTIVQIAIVGLVADVGLSTVPAPDELWARTLLGVLALPVLATGIAVYLGSHLGAGPMEAAALAWDPPLRFAWSYNAFQLLSALVGWLLGAPLGVGTAVVVVALGPLVTLAGRLLRLDVHQPRPEKPHEPQRA
jgi:uncharacterized membrane protein YczE